MNSKTILGISIAAVFAVSILTTSAYAGAVLGFLDLKKASVNSDASKLKKATIETFGKIPTRGQGGAFGYGVLTSNHPMSVMVSTTHGGVLDSVVQKGNINSPKWHNHYVKLATDEGGPCDTGDEVNDDGLHVADISYESPGKVVVQGKKISMSRVPTGTQDTHFGLAPNVANSFMVGTPGDTVVSFTLRLVGSGPYGPEQVCVDNVKAITT